MPRLLAAFAASGLIIGCAGLRLADDIAHLPAETNLEEVPFHPQTEYHCGPASLATVLEHSDAAVDYDQLVDRVYIPDRQGSLQAELTATVRSTGRIAYRLPARPEAVFAQVAAGYPVLVLENHGLESRPLWHYAVVVGYDRQRNRVLLRSGEEYEQSVSAGQWLRRWDRAGRWALVVLEPGQWPADPDRQSWIGAVSAFETGTDPDTARELWRQTIERWPDEPIAWLGLGNAHFTSNDYSQAAESYRRLLELAPDHAAGRFNLAMALKRLDRPCQAAHHLNELEDHPQLNERTTRQLAPLAEACQRRRGASKAN